MQKGPLSLSQHETQKSYETYCTYNKYTRDYFRIGNGGISSVYFSSGHSDYVFSLILVILNKTLPTTLLGWLQTVLLPKLHASRGLFSVSMHTATQNANLTFGGNTTTNAKIGGWFDQRCVCSVGFYNNKREFTSFTVLAIKCDWKHMLYAHRHTLTHVVFRSSGPMDYKSLEVMCPFILSLTCIACCQLVSVCGMR